VQSVELSLAFKRSMAWLLAWHSGMVTLGELFAGYKVIIAVILMK